MKKNWRNISMLCALLLLAACSGSTKQQPEVTQTQASFYYTCSMHPQVHEDKPGNCPICGMTLVKKSEEPVEQTLIDLQTVMRPVNASVIAHIKTVHPTEKTMADTVHAAGYLAFDTRRFNNIAARFSGRIEKLYIKYSFQQIRKGQRIMDIYSPEMVTAQQDLLYLQQTSSNEPGLIKAARDRLLLLGMTEAQISTLIRTGRPFYSLPVYSNYSGHVHDATHSQMMNAGAGNNNYNQTTPLNLREGMYVQKGQTLFQVLDEHQVWALLKIKPADVSGIRVGQPVTLTIPDASMTMTGEVNFIAPIQTADKTTTVRVYLENHDHHMHVGSVLRGDIAAGSKKGLWLPRAAVLSLGQQSMVWLKNAGVYEAQAVSTGLSRNNEVQITTGLSTTDSVAADAQYLVGSDSFIKTRNGND
ncbi:efflux RND transporter periplasmic adaptor subunit [Mucilaginibacter segetis]|uniref:Efflux RND transporter periplasmic adaptor subunit n=1 Tax=Mucilaginibacter segetis TaxID=2793071 RepID=A0A934PTD1_9SPHI|nr:efflux RND transporter periplasmic adaptor subunit [Mucilaginibacter segetis]MBK0379232.1 efflux RND transporter periplasmic adaptor subunit [Mucilaginibacter segetis]